MLVGHVAPCCIAIFRLFQLDDIGAQKSQDLSASWTRLVMRHVDDPYAAQRSFHTISPCRMSKPLPSLARLPCSGKVSPKPQKLLNH